MAQSTSRRAPRAPSATAWHGGTTPDGTGMLAPALGDLHCWLVAVIALTCVAFVILAITVIGCITLVAQQVAPLLLWLRQRLSS